MIRRVTRFASFRHALAVCLLPLVLASCAPSGPSDAGVEAKTRTISVAILTDSGQHEYRVELAITPDEQARGLMYRQHMDRDAGMMFPYDPPRPAGFWMKNTYISLDMIFIAPDGTIESVAADAIPLSTSTYASRGAVQAVLELNAGEAARIGAKRGDRVNYELPQ